MPLVEDDEYQPYDPNEVRAVEATEPDPVPVRASVDVPPDTEPKFDDRAKEAFTGLMYVGALTKSFTFAGHHITLRTLMTEELIAIGDFLRQFDGSVAFDRAYATTMVACSLVAVDKRKDLPVPFGENETLTQWVSDRYDVVKKWGPRTIDVIYSEFLELEQRVEEVLEAMGKASG